MDEREQTREAWMQEHIEQIQRANGKRVELLDMMELPRGWVVTSEVPAGFWDKCRTYAVPLKAKRFLWVFPTAATREYAAWVDKLGKDILVAVIPDDEVMDMCGYSGGPLLLADLDRDPKELLEESLVVCTSDRLLSDAKRQCAMMLYGWVDTK